MNMLQTPCIVSLLAIFTFSCTSGSAANSVASEPSSGCEKTGKQIAKQDTIVIDGVARSFYIVPSTDSNASNPKDLVLYFHGYGGNGKASGECGADMVPGCHSVAAPWVLN